MPAGKLSTRSTPRTALTPTTPHTVYHRAKQLFSRSADPGELIGREEERAQMKEFLNRCKTSQPSGCLYVSGPPGTGKSAMVTKLTDDVVSESSSIRKAYVNCMSIKSSKDLFITLLNQLDGDTEMSESDVVAALEKLFLGKGKSSDVFLVVLDEIDHILTMGSESLYRLFGWSLQRSSRLTLIGIANALDLTDRFLPRLKSRNLKPELLPFPAYTAPQFKRIITARLKSLMPEGSGPSDFIPFFKPEAIELCSRKVSSQTGDLRRAFEVCRRAIDLVENETKQQILQMSPSRGVLGENRNLASSPRASGQSPSKSAAPIRSLHTLTIETAPRVTIAHLNKITAAVFSNGASQRLKTLNLQQKAALCSLVAIEKRNRAAAAAQTPSSSSPSTPFSTPSSKRKSSSPHSSSSTSSSQVSAPTVKTLFEAYRRLCTEDSLLDPLSGSEFREVLDSLEALSLVAPVDGRTGSFAALPNHPAAAGGSGRRTRKKDVFWGGGMGSGLADDKRVASCVSEKEVELAVEGGMGVGILRGILSGEALD